MIVAITGTPGVGKTSVSEFLQDKGYNIIDLNKIINENDFVTGFDEKRDSKLVDLEKINQFILKNYQAKELIFIESHLSHSLECIDKVILLRLHPNNLKKHLYKKGWKEEKIKENLEAEVLDVILCDIVDNYKESDIFEIDTTDKSIETIGNIIIDIAENNFENMKSYKIGNIDWSEEILNL